MLYLLVVRIPFNKKFNLRVAASEVCTKRAVFPDEEVRGRAGAQLGGEWHSWGAHLGPMGFNWRHSCVILGGMGRHSWGNIWGHNLAAGSRASRSALRCVRANKSQTKPVLFSFPFFPMIFKYLFQFKNTSHGTNDFMLTKISNM